MQSFQTNDRVTLKYIDTAADTHLGSVEAREKGVEVLILIHGFTGSSAVWQRNLPAFSEKYRVIVPDLRGHGESDKCQHGYHVSRLAMDLRELLAHLDLLGKEGKSIKVIGGSLGCAILWSYAELFTTHPFSHIIFVDQSPLQNLSLDGWDARYCNRGMNTAASLATLQTTLSLSPETAHKGTIASCLAYLSHPLPGDGARFPPATRAADEAFFLGEALRGDAVWYGKLMADHTALDWRDAIRAAFGPASGSDARVLVVASSRSGCFPAEGPLKLVEYINSEAEEGRERASGVVVDWGGHWCYWEDPARFNELCLDFLAE